MEGTVKFFLKDKGYGFISTTDGDIFVHYTNTLDKIQKDDEVEFELEKGQRGPKAVNVKRKKKAD